jgi:hypothetical protein
MPCPLSHYRKTRMPYKLVIKLMAFQADCLCCTNGFPGPAVLVAVVGLVPTAFVVVVAPAAAVLVSVRVDEPTTTTPPEDATETVMPFGSTVCSPGTTV